MFNSLTDFAEYYTDLERLAKEAKAWIPTLKLNGYNVTLELIVYGQNKPDMTYQTHFHPVYESHLCLDGKSQYTVENSTCDINPGMVILHPPQVPHSWQTNENPWTILVFWLNIDPAPTVSIPVVWPVIPVIFDELILLLLDYSEGMCGWQERCIARFSIIISHILCLADTSLITPHTFSANDIIGENIRYYLLLNIAQQITVTGVANYANMSVRNLHRWFQQHTGNTLMNYLFDLRMEQAAQRLLRTDDSITEIGKAVGFPDPSYFCRRFRKYFKTSPQSYRSHYHLPRFLSNPLRNNIVNED